MFFQVGVVVGLEPSTPTENSEPSYVKDSQYLLKNCSIIE